MRPAPERAARDGDEASAGANVVPLRAAPPPATPSPAPQAAEQAGHEDAQPAEPISVRTRSRSGLLEKLERTTVAPLPSGEPRTQPGPGAEPRFHLTLDHDVVDGPTIGPKTAERLYPHGIKTVRDLLKAEPAALGVLLDNRHIMPETIAD